MTVTLNQPELLRQNRDGSCQYRLSWSSNLSSPTFYLYDLSGGQLLYSGPAEEYIMMVAASQPLVFFITDDSEDTVPTAYPGRLTLRWYESADSDYYLIEEYVDAAWTERARINDDGRFYYTWQSRYLEDVTSHQFRISAIDTAGNASSVAAFSAFLIRRPNAPRVDYSYNAVGATVTITES